MTRSFLSSAIVAAAIVFAAPAWADKIAVLPFTSPKALPRPELEEVRRWTREAVTKEGHTFASADEMVSAEASVKDNVADTSQEYQIAAEIAAADWTLTARVERIDRVRTWLPDGAEEEGFTTYRVELEAYQASSGRVESLSREVSPDEGPSDLAEMLALLIRPEGIADAVIPWSNVRARRPKAKPKLSAPRPEAPPPPRATPLPLRDVYGAGRSLALGASVGVTDALVRPSEARGPSLAMPVGVAFGYALAEAAPGLELKGHVTSQVIGPRALELSAGARYALTPLRGVRLFVGPELMLGAHVALGADKTARFLSRGSLFVAYGLTERVQAELAGDLAAALGGAGALVLGGGTARVVVRF